MALCADRPVGISTRASTANPMTRGQQLLAVLPPDQPDHGRTPTGPGRALADPLAR